LLVEDNELNQQVASELMRDEGLVVDIADNGAIAVERLNEATYDVVLMDMQMPVMDGITATTLIRTLPEHQTLPIVAMTANAMQADRDRCKAAGMNDYVSKPIDPLELWATLLRWIAPRAPVEEIAEDLETRIPPAQPVPTLLPAAIAGLDMLAGMSHMGGKASLYRDMLVRFCQTQNSAAREIEAAALALQWEQAERTAHTLKGLAGNIGAKALQSLGQSLESMLKNAQADSGMPDLLARTQEELQKLVEAITQALASLVPADAEISQQNLAERMAEVPEILAQLASYLSNSDAAAADLLSEHQAVLRASLGALLDPLRAAVDGFDFDEALSILRQHEVA
jgi:CheY-like chemotaxis protein